jgi:hypothetical protein
MPVIGPRKPPKRVALERRPEQAEQVALAKWLDARGVLWCHVPNGGKRSISIARQLKAAGTKAGVPDVLIFTPPPKNPGAHGVAIELKSVKIKGLPRGQVMAEQERWLNELNHVGWHTTVAWGCEEAMQYLLDLGY